MLWRDNNNPQAMKKMLNIYLAHFELGPSSSLYLVSKAGVDMPNIKGGFVAVAAPADDIRGALDKCEAALIEDGYKIQTIESIGLYDPEENSQFEDELLKIIHECSEIGGVAYGTFYTYEKSEFH